MKYGSTPFYYFFYLLLFPEKLFILAFIYTWKIHVNFVKCPEIRFLEMYEYQPYYSPIYLII